MVTHTATKTLDGRDWPVAAITMKDFLGNECFVGDIVAYARLGYRSLNLGEIIRITEKCVFIKDEDNINGVTKQYHAQVIRAGTAYMDLTNEPN